MNNETTKQRILAALRRNPLAVVSTIDSSDSSVARPESAVVAFAESDALGIFFGTSNGTRKYANLAKNPNVSFAMGWDGGDAVQYEGVARELSGAEVAAAVDAIVTKNPHAKYFLLKEDARIFSVKPTWVRLLDMTESKGQAFEIVF